jgi:hypothetical protein
MNSFLIWHIILQVGKTQDLSSKIWQTQRCSKWLQQKSPISGSKIPNGCKSKQAAVSLWKKRKKKDS